MLEINQDLLQKLFIYDQNTGLFIRRIKRRQMKAGEICGTVDSRGYIVITICNKKLLAHRLAYLYATGKEPEHTIDHINGIRSDNRFSNLRSATYSENLQNRRTVGTRNKTGYLGVHCSRDKYVATIVVNGKSIHLGKFSTAPEAYQAYVNAKRIHHPYGEL